DLGPGAEGHAAHARRDAAHRQARAPAPLRLPLPLGDPMTRLALPHWAGTLALKAAVFITVMCCGLAAMLGVLVHVSVTNQTVGQARDLALSRLADATKAYQAGDTLLPG